MAANNTEEERRIIDSIDAEMAKLFERRMEIARRIALSKKESGRPIEDLAREQSMLESRLGNLENGQLKDHYIKFLKNLLSISKDYQNNIIHGAKMPGNDIIIERGILSRAGDVLGIDGGKVLIVTDCGVPEMYSKTVADSLRDRATSVTIHTFQRGENHKNIDSYREVMTALVEGKFTRTDTVVAVGGGVVGDLAGFVAATFMRGIRFFNIPTTLLSQVDSSVGGKTAIDFDGVKNIVGAFHMPRKVLIDPDTLYTLPMREVHNGLVEAIKMGATSDAELFSLIERSNDLHADIEEIIRRSLNVKKAVVDADPTEKGLRRVLNFGHTVGHAIEACGNGKYLHGEAVGLGMLYFCSPEAAQRIRKVLEKYSLPVEHDIPAESLVELIAHDKKAAGSDITVVRVDEIGSFSFEKININELAL